MENVNVSAPLSGHVGALCGSVWGQISNCSVVNGSVAGKVRVGGLVGSANLINNCYSDVTVTGLTNVGGLVGYTSGDVGNSYSLGTVSGTSSVGGLVGKRLYPGNINNSFAAGKVSGTSSIGGFVGYVDERLGAPAFTGCFWDNTVNPDLSGIDNITDPEVVGESTANMKVKGTYLDRQWDFQNEPDGTEDHWRMCVDGLGYPKLRWQFAQGDLACPDGVSTEDLLFLSEHWLDTDYGTVEGAELSGDGKVGVEDIIALSEYWLTFDCGDCDGRDLTGDGNVDLADFAYISERWNMIEYGNCEGAELTGDGIVNLQEFALFAENWLEG
jgi:hypothetical protein